MIKKLSFLFTVLVSACLINAQVSVVSVNLQAFQVSPEALLNVNIMNSGTDKNVELQTVLYNSNNEVLMSVRSNPFTIKQGLNVSSGTTRTVKTTEYGSGNQAAYVKTSRLLPGGRFKICASIVSINNSEPLDEFCDEIESEFSQYLYLVTPGDKDTIDQKYPLLIWNHSEPFSLLAQGEYYRMIVTEIQKDQTADEASTVNSPLMFKNYLNTHQLQYPYDAKELQAGHRYAWQVQKMANGVVVNKSEAWEFVISPKIIIKENKYAALKKKPDAGIFNVSGSILYFKFDEDYAGTVLTAIILDEHNKVVLPKVKTDDSENLVNSKNYGYNKYQINLDDYSIKNGFYTLEVKNEKKETFYLKFYVE